MLPLGETTQEIALLEHLRRLSSRTRAAGVVLTAPDSVLDQRLLERTKPSAEYAAYTRMFRSALSSTEPVMPYTELTLDAAESPRTLVTSSLALVARQM